MKNLLLSGFALSLLLPLQAQKGKPGYPGPNEGKLIILLKDFAKKPVGKAAIMVEAVEGGETFEGKTNKNGVCELIVPNGKTYWISVEDSSNYDQVTVQKKPYIFVRRTVYYQGAVNGKVKIPERPVFSMKPPADGLASVEMTFVGLSGAPLEGEKVWMDAVGSQQQFEGVTDGKGFVHFKVPVGETYVVRVKYNSRFDRLNFPKHGGSYNAKLRYGYAGTAAIESAREQRRINDSLHNAYRQLAIEQQKKMRDEQFHKTIFRPTSTWIKDIRLRKTETPYGYDIKMTTPSAMTSPLWLDGKLFAGGGFETSQLHAFDQDGNQIWSVTLGEGGPSALSGEGDIVVTATESCTIYALDTKTGKQIWSKWLASYVLSAPSVKDGKVFIGYEDRIGGEIFNETRPPSHVMACFDLKTGDICWQQWIYGEPMSAAVAEGDRLYFSTFGGYTYSLNRESGEIIQEQPLLSTSSPVVRGGEMYISQRDDQSAEPRERIAIYDAASFQLKHASEWRDAPYISKKVQRQSKYWMRAENMSLSTGYDGSDIATSGKMTPEELVGVRSIQAVQGFQGARVLPHEGKLYASMGNELVCVDAATGNTDWSRKIAGDIYLSGGFLLSPPILAGGDLIIACLDGNIRFFNPKNGRMKREIDTNGKFRVQPIAMNGFVYATSTNGKFIAVDAGDPSYDGWQCWGGDLGRNNRGK